MSDPRELIVWDDLDPVNDRCSEDGCNQQAVYVTPCLVMRDGVEERFDKTRWCEEHHRS